MSYKLVDAAFTIFLPQREKSVLLAVCRHARDDGTQSRASLDTLSNETGLQLSSGKRAFRWLVDNKFIVKTSGTGGGRHSQTVSYSVLLPNADVVAALFSTYKKRGARSTGARSTGCRPSRTGCRLSRTGCRLSRTGCRLSRTGCRLSRMGCRLSRTGCRLSRTGCRLSYESVPNLSMNR